MSDAIPDLSLCTPHTPLARTLGAGTVQVNTVSLTINGERYPKGEAYFILSQI